MEPTQTQKAGATDPLPSDRSRKESLIKSDRTYKGCLCIDGYSTKVSNGPHVYDQTSIGDWHTDLQRLTLLELDYLDYSTGLNLIDYSIEQRSLLQWLRDDSETMVSVRVTMQGKVFRHGHNMILPRTTAGRSRCSSRADHAKVVVVRVAIL